MVPYFENGIIGASIYQDPYAQGQTALKVLVDHVLEKGPIASNNSLNPGIVLQANLHFFREVHLAGIGARDLTAMRTGERVSLSVG
jgi:ABC-type sugar transport system substrate-binding protein